MSNLKPLALGVAIGVLWAVYMFILAIMAMFGWGNAMVDIVASLYIGYGASIVGAVVGAVWGFVDGFILGFAVAWIYNLVAK
jgi:hypothetical protein